MSNKKDLEALSAAKLAVVHKVKEIVELHETIDSLNEKIGFVSDGISPLERIGEAFKELYPDQKEDPEEDWWESSDWEDSGF